MDEAQLQDSAYSAYDVVVIGAGPAGENAADYAVRGSGRTAVLIEAELVGGECSYWACMPSKALLRPVEVLDSVRTLPGLSGTELDVAGVLARRDAFTSHHDDSGQVRWANGAGIDVLRGRARLTAPRTVEVTAADGTVTTLRARQAVVLATGTGAAVPPVPGLAEALPWTSRDVTNLAEVPRRVAVIGGGVVGCESATWLNGLGAEQVTLIQSNRALLPRDEPFVHDLVAERLRDAGVEIRTGARLESVSRPHAAATGIGHVHGGEATLFVDGAELVVDEVVVAVGRTPATAGLGLDAVGVALDPRGYVPVDEHLAVRTDPADGDWLYAVGDVNGLALLTHMGKYQARVCGAVIAARAEGRPLDGPRYRNLAGTRVVPQVVFTLPQVATVGLTERAARDAGLDVETVEYDLAALAGTSLQRDGYRGRAKLVIDRAEDVLLGATFVGPEVSELVHAATVAVIGAVPLELLRHAVPSYPTPSEIWLRLLESREAPKK